MDQMVHAFLIKRKTKWWPHVVFFNILDLVSITSRVVFKIKYSQDILSHKDNRQRFNIDVGRSFAFSQVARRSAVASLQNPVKQDISAVLNYLQPKASSSATPV